MSRQLTVAVLGATGAVGREMIRILEERSFPVARLLPLASPRSAGTTVPFRGTQVKVEPVSADAFTGVDLALFSAGSGPSKEWGPIAASKGALVVDNSSAWRMDPEVPLCVPEVNLDAARNPKRGIIANPNCSTIQMLVALAPIHRANRIQRIVVSTYQAISGAGHSAVEHFRAQSRAFAAGEPMPAGPITKQLAGSLLMEWKRDGATGYQEEELKMIHETRKIFGDPDIRVSPTTVRVPVVNGHSESVAIECERPITAKEARALMTGAPGVRVVDDFEKGVYPTPLDASGIDDVLVGRVRDDLGNPGGVMMWIVGDNLRKGAATNAVQIAEGLLLR
ncbi:aspartate-semialdehyde dehydrogenase [Sandaracinus amylolyticus]|uniref:aspartate-semialdehyde dehydrogenase n=1 Tax=Sandaracinus amylolyticus TaxID=927083 RepID=UPI00069E02DE|nr:aspartate-semialdehyde dehydrogenase [Sandaracinus amylolyticus]